MDIEELYSRFTECNGLTTDSRHCPEGSMFLALRIHVSCWWKIAFRRCSSWPITIVVSYELVWWG